MSGVEARRGVKRRVKGVREGRKAGENGTQEQVDADVTTRQLHSVDIQRVACLEFDKTPSIHFHRIHVSPLQDTMCWTQRRSDRKLTMGFRLVP